MSAKSTHSSNPPSRGGDPLPARQRRRKIWSCMECRRRKLQCDRGLPICSRCSKSGRASDCIYIDDVPDVPVRASHESVRGRFTGTIQGPLTSGDSSALQLLTQRIQRLEALLPQTRDPLIGSSSNSAPKEFERGADTQPDPSPASDKDWLPNVRGKAFSTRFNGGTHVSIILKQMPGIEQYSREAFDKYPTMDRIRLTVHQSETFARTIYPGSPMTLEKLAALLPPKAEADALVETYLNSFEFVYHILHLPTFEDAYEQVWKTGTTHQQNFLAVLLLIIAIGLCMMPTPLEKLDSHQFSPRDRATTIIQSCEEWLQSKPMRYNRLIDFQAAFLLLLARQINGRRYKQTWPNSGKIIRLFMNAGLHRESEYLGSAISLDREMRRRIWAAAAEFELQASFEQGMPPTPWAQQCNILGPKDIPDTILSGSISPADQDQTLTQAWYLSISAHSLSLRYYLTNILNDTSGSIDFSDAKNLTEKIITHLSHVSRCSRPGIKTISSLLSLNLHQFQLALHMRQIAQSNSSLERDFSLMILWNTAREVIHIHREVLSNGDVMLQVLCGDQFRAVLALCYAFITSKTTQSMTRLHLADKDLSLCTHHAVELMRHKMLHFGGDQRPLWITMACHSYMKVLDEPHRRDSLLELTVREFVGLVADEETIHSDPHEEDCSTKGDHFATTLQNPVPSDHTLTGLEASDGMYDWDNWDCEMFNPQDFVNFLDMD